MLFNDFPLNWKNFLSLDFQTPEFKNLSEFITLEDLSKTILPPVGQRFTAFHLTPPEKVRVVILGQDPYPTIGHAHGLAFSYLGNGALPRSLNNIFKELKSDLDRNFITNSGDLSIWAKQGVLLLNVVLTVEAGKPNSHKNKGWEHLTFCVIQKLLEQTRPIVFILWGNDAQQLVKNPPHHHTVFATAHPSPLSAARGFFNSSPFSRTSNILTKNGYTPIDWLLGREEDQLF